MASVIYVERDKHKDVKASYFVDSGTVNGRTSFRVVRMQLNRFMNDWEGNNFMGPFETQDAAEAWLEAEAEKNGWKKM